jgi:hypothetical protein
MILATSTTYGRDATDRLDGAADPSPDGAAAALETFYHAFNQRSLRVLSAVWLDDPLVQLNNPLGGILRGAEAIRSLYARVFDGPARVWVEFGDIVEFRSGGTVTYAGRERGEFAVGDTVVPLAIRTSRVFTHTAGVGWRQVHHHGSIDDPDTLRDYQAAVRGTAPTDA